MKNIFAGSWPLHIFAFLLIPLSCWQVWVFPSIPNYYAQHFLLYPCLVFMLWAWKKGLWTPPEAWRLARPFLPWLIALFAVQTLADWRSARLFLPEDAPLGRAVLFDLIRLGAQLPFALFFALLCRVALREEKSRRCLLRGAIWAFGLLAFWCAVQAVYIYTTPSENWTYLCDQQIEHPVARATAGRLLFLFSPLLEARWENAFYDFYSQGAYALTLPRFNGFFEEASALAAMVGVFFAPLAFGLLGLSSRRNFRLAGGVMLLCCFVILLFCRSRTGWLLALAGLLLILWAILRRQWGARAALMAAGLMLVCLWAALLAGQSQPEFRQRLAKMGKLPRMVCLLDTVDMIKAHPLLGVGRNWYFAHLHNGERYLAHLSNPELRFWKEQGSGGELSALPALAAQYGLPLTLLALGFVGRVCWRLRRMRRARPDSALLAFMVPASVAWLVLGLTVSLGSVDIRNPLFCLPFFCFYAVSQGVGLEESLEGGATCRAA
ncbi:O-antigen ligase family protein [Desulfovibrio sp. SGI.169]|uniref:O-antigen ligase family protein n=1 Tax=Desulfovibrio sp. SGI.169 TaxID=3420561 RepID=UPI003D04FA7A